MKIYPILVAFFMLTILVTATGCGPFTPTKDEIERGGYNEEGEKTCRCLTLFSTNKTCMCVKEVITGEPDKIGDHKK